MDKADKIKQQKKASYNRNKDAINAKRRQEYLVAKNNQSVGDIFTTDGINSLKLKNPSNLSDKIQWSEGIKVPTYLDAVQNKSQTYQPNSSLYNNIYNADQQTDNVKFNEKILRPPPTSQIFKPTPRAVISKADVPAWKKNGNEHTFASDPDFISHYPSGFF